MTSIARVAQIIFERIAVPSRHPTAYHWIGRSPLLAVVFDFDGKVLGSPSERQHVLAASDPASSYQGDISSTLFDRFAIAFEEGFALTAFSDAKADRIGGPVARVFQPIEDIGGMAAASSNTAGGGLVSGWFPPEKRGLAMGIRQTAQPLGIALGALVIPELTERNPSSGLMFPALICTVAAVACAIGVVDPPRKSRKRASEEPRQ